MPATTKAKRNKGKNLIESLANYVVIDIETTGLDPQWDNIIEVAAVRVENGVIIDTVQSLVNPGHGIDSFITDLTGITNAMLADAPTVDLVMPNLIDFISDSVVVAHNAHFDINFIYDDCLRILKREFANNFVDTMRVSRRLFKEHTTHTLSALIERFNIEKRTMHRALADATITHECYEYMRAYAAENNISFASLYPKDARATDITTSNTEFDELSTVFGRLFVFTGVLEKMQRKEAMQIVVNMGGLCADKVNKKTNFLVLGNNDYCSTIKDGKSTKQKAADKLALAGADIQTISKNVFYDMIADYST